jgi:ribosomal protein L29
MAIARKKEEYDKKETKDLLEVLAEKEKLLMDTKISLAQGKTKNAHSKRNIRKEIARVKTVLRLKNLNK